MFWTGCSSKVKVYNMLHYQTRMEIFQIPQKIRCKTKVEKKRRCSLSMGQNENKVSHIT